MIAKHHAPSVTSAAYNEQVLGPPFIGQDWDHTLQRIYEGSNDAYDVHTSLTGSGGSGRQSCDERNAEECKSKKCCSAGHGGKTESLCAVYTERLKNKCEKDAGTFGARQKAEKTCSIKWKRRGTKKQNHNTRFRLRQLQKPRAAYVKTIRKVAGEVHCSSSDCELI